jgi:hypothetical protein
LSTTTTITPTQNAASNGARRLWWKEALKESAGLGVAEMISAAVSIGVFTFADDIAPESIKKISHVVSKVGVLPFLDTIEKAMNNCKLEECKPDFTKSREERAEQYAHYLTLFGIATIPAVATELGVRMGMNRMMDVKHAGNTNAVSNPNQGFWSKLKPSWHDIKVVGTDKTVQLGGIIAVNTIFAKQADHGIKSISHILQNSFGLSEEQATKAADAFVIWHLADGLGLGVADAHIFLDHYNRRNK